MSSNDVICRVCALYPYASTDASSLSFDQGAVIDVLAQLDSGWWDGWCNGKRGWFPSNYVQIIETSSDQTKDSQFWHHGQPDLSWTSRRAPYPAPPQYSLQQQQQQQQQQQHPFHPQYQQQPPSQPPQHQQHLPRSTMHDLQHQQQLRLSLAADNMLLHNPTTNIGLKDHDTPQAEPSNWILQTTEDGSEVYYYNTVTKEMRYSVPPEEMSTVYQSPPASAKSYTYKSSDYYDADDYIDEKPRPPVRAPQRTLDEHSSLASVSTSTMSTMSSPSLRTAQSGNDDQLPPNWVRKCTPKGREYYCNLLTDETAWSLEHVDPITGATMNPNPPTDDLDDAARVEVDADEHVRSWSQLNAAIANAIRNLKSSLKQGQIALFREDTLLVVHHIRLLLYMSNSVDKESSPYLKSNKQLKAHHRALLAALAKLVLSAKVASGAWAPMEAIGKLQVDADEVLMAVRNFLLVAQEMNITMHESKPRLVDDLPPASRWRNKGNPEYLFDSKRPDVTTTLLVLADNVHGAMASFMDSAREAFSAASQQEEGMVAKIMSSTPLLVAQFRNLSNTASQFLNALDDIQQTTTPRFAVPKQAIHNAMGSLFIASQTITSQDMTPSAVASTFELIEGYRKTIETSVQEVCVMGRQLALEEQQQQQQQSALEKTGAGGRSSQDDVARIHAQQQQPQRAPEEEQQRRMHILGPPPSAPPPSSMPPPLPAPTAGMMQDREDSTVTANTDDYVTVQTRPPKDKLAKFFGEDTLEEARRRDTILGAPGDEAESTHSTVNTHSPRLPSTRASTPGMVPERTDFLGSDYIPSEIVFNMEGNVKGGTVTALVQRLTQHDQLDSKFITTFLLTYRSFCSTQELFDALFRRYTLIPPPDLTREELEMWQEKKLKLVRLRVFNVIKSWLEHYYNEEEDRSILPILMEFTDTIVRESMQFGAEQLIKSIRKRMDQEDDGQIRKMRLNVRTSDMPAPILPKNLKRLRFLDIDPLELARQLTIMDYKLYSRIKPVECLDKNWGKGDSEHIAANVKASIEYSNQVTAWVTDSILSKDEVKKRGAVVKHWILVAERCRYLNNFNTCMAILSAFDNSSIGRLKRTWELMSARTMGTLTGIRRLMGANKNFTEYRDIIHKVNPPCIPFLGIYLQDLTFIEDGNSNYLKKSNHLVNFAKRMKTAEVIRELQQYQSTPYLLQAVPDIQEFIKTHLQSSRDEETLYNLSLSLEPRERGEDTIARRLKESGL